MLSKLKSLMTHQGVIRYLSNTSWLLGEKILRMTVGIFVSIWLTRYLGPAQFGLYSFAISFVGIFSVIATFGLDEIIVKNLVKRKSKEGEILLTAFSLKLIGGFTAILIIAIVAIISTDDLKTIKLIMIVASAIVFQSFNVVDFFFQAKVLSKYVVFSNGLVLFISSLLKITLILIEAPLEAFAWVVLLDSIILAAGLLIFFSSKSSLTFQDLRFNKSYAYILLKESWPLMLSGLVISVYMKIDQIMLKGMLGNEAVGIYAAAVRLSEAWYFIPLVICSSVFPAIINAKILNQDLYNERLQKLFDSLLILALIIAVPMTFISTWLAEFLYGNQYSAVGNVLSIHIWAGIFVFLGIASSKWLIAEDLQIYYTINTTIGMVINIILNYILIKKFGVEGSAWATLIAQFTAAYLSLSFWVKTRPNFLSLSRSLLFFWVIRR
ncbi:flippase [Gammaproteobacteria bacterium]|jgi:O-antigen/teichoic acid export membrane protein|nr:flippase [Gammaproteobacteria bacterium]